jgi:nucleoside permease NupC
VTTDKSPLYQFWFNTLHFSLHMTLNGLILFFLCSAAYRAMRIKNVGSGIMVITTILIALAAVPIGELIWPGFSVISSWLMDFPSAGANRALSLTTGIGIVIFGARVLFWKEKRVYGQ